MDATTILNAVLVSIAGLGFLGAFATRFGCDSRPTIGDDHAR